MSSTHVNGGDAVKPTSQQNTVPKQPLKGGAAGKALDAARKQAASPVDSQNKKQTPPQPKAWQGPNPITSRANTASHLPNGADKQAAKPNSQANVVKAGTEPHAEKLAHDRLLFLLANMTGQDATVTLKTGEQYTGVFSGGSFHTSPKSTYTLKMVKRTRSSRHQQSNGVVDNQDEYIGEGENHVMSFDIQDTIDLAVQDVALASAQPSQNGTFPTTSRPNFPYPLTGRAGSIASSFRTDTEISGREPRMPRERELQRWQPEAGVALEDMSLDASSSRGWDQFAANEQTFGVQSSYDEDIYTSSIDRTHPLYHRRLADAERKAREIESSEPANSHIAEERRRDANRDDAGDEEEKYSGVKRDFSPLAKGTGGTYIPPSRRPITSQPTVPGAPYDPAIIASQLAKPAASPSPRLNQNQQAVGAASKVPSPERSLDPLQKSSEQKPTSSEAAAADNAKVSASSSSQQPTKKSENTTEDRVRDTADAFKQFANNEKLRLRQAQEQKRTNARHEKNVRINDLKKFAENFKLKSRVPDDLVPILAKDHEKQVEIKRKAEEAAVLEERRSTDRDKDKSRTGSSASAVSPATSAAGADPKTAPPTQSQQQQAQPRPRPAQNRNNLSSLVPQPIPGMSPRQAQLFNRPPRHNVQGQQPAPAELRIPTGPALHQESGPMSPTSATRLNVNAKAFEFRPAASNFTPSGTSPSPRRTAAGLPAQAATPSFFDEKEKAVVESAKGNAKEDGTNIVSHLQDAGLTEEQKKLLVISGGVPQPYRTAPTWTIPEERLNLSFSDAFPKPQSHGPSPMHTPNPAGSQGPHGHNLPPHFQAQNMSTPQQHRFYPHQQGGMPHPHAHGFDPRMQYPGGPGSSVQNSPRFPPAQMAAFNGQMPQMGQMPQYAGQPMPGFGMSPNMGYRQLHQMPPGGAPVMMMPGQPHGPMTQMRQPFPPGPQFAPNMPQMGGQMMVQQASSGGYMNGPIPPQPYSPLPPHAQPHMQHMSQHPSGPGGYSSSPRAAPHMMQPTGSHQGFPAHQMQMPYATSPGQPGPYALTHRQMSAGQYPHVTPRQQQAMPVQAGQQVSSPGMSGPVQSQGDEGK